MDAYGSEKAERVKLWPTTNIDYAGSWTFMHMQFEEKPDGQGRICATLNAMKMQCKKITSKSKFNPLRFIEALELTTEMLVAPIEISTSWLTPSQVQQNYYRKADYMSKVLGPSTSERERLELTSKVDVRQSFNFDQSIILMAPPLIFQRRVEKTSCKSKVTSALLEAQLNLIQAAHCSDAVCPNITDVEDVVTCTSGDKELTQKRYFGLSLTDLDGEKGYTDFLYAIADNPIVVRDGSILDTDRFIDAQSVECIILALFHLPETGLTSEVKVSIGIEMGSVEPEITYNHYGFVPANQKDKLVLYFAILCILLASIYILNLKFYLMFRHETKILDVEFDKVGRFEILYDWIQATIVVAFLFVQLGFQLQTETWATEIVEQVSGVPFESPDELLESKINTFFAAVENLHWGFQVNAANEFFAFVIIILMLLR